MTDLFIARAAVEMWLATIPVMAAIGGRYSDDGPLAGAALGTMVGAVFGIVPAVLALAILHAIDFVWSGS